MELSKFKCLCAYVFYISFFLFSFSDPMAVSKYGVS